jgi:hypothetical protein
MCLIETRDLDHWCGYLDTVPLHQKGPAGCGIDAGPGVTTTNPGRFVSRSGRAGGSVASRHQFCDGLGPLGSHRAPARKNC